MPKQVGSRQQPGYACEECRKRKLRCDRKRPRCDACTRSGIACKVTERRAPRSLRQSDIGDLNSRIAGLEQRLTSIQRGNTVTQSSEPVNGSDINGLLEFERNVPEESLEWQGSNPVDQLNSEGSYPSPFALLGESSAVHSLSPLPPEHGRAPRVGQVISDLMGADLTELYFDRVHPIVPMLNKSRTCSWSRDADSLNEYRECLQHAMWTLAMAHSTQFEHLRNEMYLKTRVLLESLDQKDGVTGICHLEHVQAWLLITYYEFTKVNYRHGWLSAGHAFRLVQLSRIYSIDMPKNLDTTGVIEDLVRLEEKRRTFWVAYCLDRQISVSNGVVTTLNEEVVCTRLPCLDDSFQYGLVENECFLSEALTLEDTRKHSLLAECAMMVTICGRALSHKNLSAVESVYGAPSEDFDVRHSWLDSMASRRLQTLQANYPLTASSRDPIIIFGYMLAHCTTIYLYQILEFSSSSDTLETPNISDNRQIQLLERAIWAAQEISRLASDHHDTPFKAHTFMPLPIFVAAARLKMHLQNKNGAALTVSTEAVEASLQAAVEALGKLRKLNELAGHYLNILESTSEFHLSMK